MRGAMPHRRAALTSMRLVPAAATCICAERAAGSSSTPCGDIEPRGSRVDQHAAGARGRHVHLRGGRCRVKQETLWKTLHLGEAALTGMRLVPAAATSICAEGAAGSSSKTLWRHCT